MSAAAPAGLRAALRLEADRSTAADVAAHLARCSDAFVPPLAARVVLADYAARLVALAAREEAWDGDVLVGLVAIYCNRPGEAAFVSSVSVDAGWRGDGLAATLLGRAVERARCADAPCVELEVDPANAPARRLYRRAGFVPTPVGRTPARIEPAPAVLRLRRPLHRTDRP